MGFRQHVSRPKLSTGARKSERRERSATRLCANTCTLSHIGVHPPGSCEGATAPGRDPPGNTDATQRAVSRHPAVSRPQPPLPAFTASSLFPLSPSETVLCTFTLRLTRARASGIEPSLSSRWSAQQASMQHSSSFHQALGRPRRRAARARPGGPGGGRRQAADNRLPAVSVCWIGERLE